MTFHLNDLESFVHTTSTFSTLVGLAPVIFDALPCPIFIKNSESRFIFINKAYENHFGINKKEILGKSVMDLDYLDMEARVQYQLEDTYIIRNTISKHHEYNYTFTDGTIHQCLYWSCGFHDQDEDSRGLIGFLVDISQNKLTSEKTSSQGETHSKCTVEDLSNRDPLTGMQDRRAFTEKLISMSKEEGKRLAFSVIMIGLNPCVKDKDLPKEKTGDDTLKLIANLLTIACRGQDSTYKWGAEEFVMLLPKTTAEAAQHVLNRLNSILEEQVSTLNKAMPLSTAIVQYDRTESIDALMDRAKDMLNVVQTA